MKKRIIAVIAIVVAVLVVGNTVTYSKTSTRHVANKDGSYGMEVTDTEYTLFGETVSTETEYHKIVDSETEAETYSEAYVSEEYLEEVEYNSLSNNW
ncbi:MAG: hypothetical protein LIP10_03760 [Clostridiales bacterium]|nr:hypothetical protein [Clostridiales bacterium]